MFELTHHERRLEWLWKSDNAGQQLILLGLIWLLELLVPDRWIFGFQPIFGPWETTFWRAFGTILAAALSLVVMGVSAALITGFVRRQPAFVCEMLGLTAAIVLVALGIYNTSSPKFSASWWLLGLFGAVFLGVVVATLGGNNIYRSLMIFFVATLILSFVVILDERGLRLMPFLFGTLQPSFGVILAAELLLGFASVRLIVGLVLRPAAHRCTLALWCVVLSTVATVLAGLWGAAAYDENSLGSLTTRDWMMVIPIGLMVATIQIYFECRSMKNSVVATQAPQRP